MFALGLSRKFPRASSVQLSLTARGVFSVQKKISIHHRCVTTFLDSLKTVIKGGDNAKCPISTEIPEFQNLDEVLNYCGVAAPDPKSLSTNVGLRNVLKTISESCSSLSVSDAITILKALAEIKKRLPDGSTLISEAGAPILKRVVQSDFSFDPDQMATMVFYLSEAGISDLSLRAFLREAIPKVQWKMSFGGVLTMLRALNRMEFREHSLLAPLSDILTDGVDFFSNEDVVDAFRLDFETNMINRRCYFKLTAIVSQNAELFTTDEIAELFRLLCSLQHLSPLKASRPIKLLESRIDALTDQQLFDVR